MHPHPGGLHWTHTRARRTFEVPVAELGPFASAAPPQLAGHVVRLRGLPFTAASADVLYFFRGIELPQASHCPERCCWQAREAASVPGSLKTASACWPS